jgi:preprotein translocase subunit SecG
LNKHYITASINFKGALMYTFLVILFILISFSMIIVILLQAGKGQGLAGAVGGGMGNSSVFGGRGAADFLSKATTWLAVTYMGFAILIGVVYKSEADTAQQSLIQQKAEEQQEVPASSIPVAPMPQETLPIQESQPSE